MHTRKSASNQAKDTGKSSFRGHKGCKFSYFFNNGNRYFQSQTHSSQGQSDFGEKYRDFNVFRLNFRSVRLILVPPIEQIADFA